MMSLAALNLTLNETLQLLNEMQLVPLEMVEWEAAQLALVALYSLTGAAALLLNALQIYILATGRRSRGGALRPYLVNVSCADMLMAVFSIPFTYTQFMLGRWVFPASWCPLVLYLQQVSVGVSVYSLVAMAVDRRRAVAQPLRRAGRARARRCIGAIWAVALLASAHVFFITAALPFHHNGRELLECGEQWAPHSVAPQVYTVLVFAATFGVPLLLLLWTYSATACALWAAAKHTTRLRVANDARATNSLKAFKISVAIVVSFVVCWLPLQTFVLLYYLVPGMRAAPASRTQRSVYGAAYFACHYLACANSCLNPLLYCFMNKNFRDDLREWFWASVVRRRAPPPRTSSLRSSGRAPCRTCTTTVNVRFECSEV